MFNRIFRCGFKVTFSGALRRVFSAMSAIQNYEVTMMRKYDCTKFDIRFGVKNSGTCYVAEFSLQSKFILQLADMYFTLYSVNGAGKKLKNGQFFDDSMNESMQYLQKDVSIMLKPETTERNLFTNDDSKRVKTLKNLNIRVPGSSAVPYAASILTILVLSYK